MRSGIPSYVALILLAFLGSAACPAAWGAVPVPILNAGFESQVIADGGYNSTISYWPEGKYDPAAPTVWILDKNNTVYNVTGVYVENIVPSDGYGGVAWEGNNVAEVTSFYQVGFAPGLYQVLTGPAAALQADAKYDLSVMVGNCYGWNKGLAPDWRIDLVAGGVILATASGPAPIDDSYWTKASLTYNSGAAPAQLGQQLEIRITGKDHYWDEVYVLFDSVSLLATYAHPIAIPGGASGASGYKAYRGGSLTLNGGGSIPSEGSSISLYEWDLNNDGTYDVTGATPGAISYATLTSTYGMVGGDNTIRLRVTDAGTAEKVTAFGTVTVLKDKLYWDTNGTDAGAGTLLTGTWGADSYWNTDDTGAGAGEFQTVATPTASTDNLYFGAGPAADSGNSAFAITVSGAQAARSLNFQSSGAPTVSGGSITLGGGTAGGGINVPQYAYGTTAQGNPAISTPIALNNSQTWTVGSGRTLTVSGAVTGSGYTLTKSGPGVLVLSNNGGNTYSGGTVIDAGRVQFNTGAVPGTGQITINSGGVLSGNAYANVGAWLASGKIVTTSSGVIAMVAHNNAAVNLTGYDNLYLGATGGYNFANYALTPGANGYLLGGGGGTLTINNAASALAAGKNLTVGGNVTLSIGSASFNGAVTVNAGTLNLNAASALGSASSVTINSGSTMTVSNATGLGSGTGITIAGGTLAVNATGTTISQPIALSGGGAITTTINTTGNTITLNGITGTGDLLLQTSGAANTHTTIVLGAACTYSGNTVIRTSSDRNMAVRAASGIANPLPATTVLWMDCWEWLRYVELDLNGNNQTLAGLKCANNTFGDEYGICLIANSSATPATLTVNNNAENVFGGRLGTSSVPVSYPAQPLYQGDNFGLTKGGSGKLTLAGINSYTGPTIVNSGTLLVNNPGTLSAASAVTVHSAARLGGDGTINGTVTVKNGASLAPGASAGKLTINNDLTMQAGSTYEWELGSIACDLVDVNGVLAIDSGWTLKLIGAGGTPGAGQYSLFTYDAFSGAFTAPAIDYGTTGWSGAKVENDAPGKRIVLTFSFPGDTNYDGVVDAADFITLKKNFGGGVGGGPAVGNFDDAGTVNWADLNILTNHMGAPGGASAVTPEPCSALLLVLGALAVIRRRRA